MPGTTSYIWLHASILTIALIGEVVWIVMARRYRSAYLGLGVSFYLLNIIAFSTVRLVGFQIEPTAINFWSLGIRLQGVITISGYGLFLLIDRRRNHE